ncbi:glutamate receptor 2.8-like [Carex rostrata]
MGKPDTFMFLLFVIIGSVATAQNTNRNIPVGVILDLDTLLGKMARTSIAMAVEDFYTLHSNYSTRLVLYTRDSNQENVKATLAALDLLQNNKTEVIIGPQKSSQAAIVSEIGNTSQVPVISFSATSPTLAFMQLPYFIRTTINDTAQIKTITSLIKAYGWREVVTIYEDTEFGWGILPFLANALEEINVRIPYRSLISNLSTYDQIKQELYKLQTMQTRVFVVHMSSSLGSNLFLMAKEVGMMGEGYVWIMTDGVTNMVYSLNESVASAMKGALGVRPYIPKTDELNYFTIRLKRRFHEDNPHEMSNEPSIYALWAYDTIYALAMTVEEVGIQNTKTDKPGETIVVPKGWEIPISGTKLRVGVTVGSYPEFMKVEIDPETNTTRASGYSVDVFEAAVKQLHYAVPFEYEHFGGVSAKSSITYDEFVYQVHLRKYDVVIGDITIRHNRTRYADFSMPYTDSGVAMIVRVRQTENKNTFIFLQPLTYDLWLGSFAFLIYAEEKLESILSKIVAIVSIFVLLILTSSYTASLSSMLTVQQLQPTVTDIYDLKNNGDYVGYGVGSFVEGLLQELGFDRTKMKGYHLEEYSEALEKGSANGGVAAIVHEIPYIKLFLAKNCKSYTMVGPIYKTAGFGFAFTKGSPLVADISSAILNITGGDDILRIEKKWIGDANCQNSGSITVESNSLNFLSFWGLFLITGVVSTICLLIYATMSFCKNRQMKINIMSPETSTDEKIDIEALPTMNQEEDQVGDAVAISPAESDTNTSTMNANMISSSESVI